MYVFRPVPEGVEFGFLVELDGDHHAVGHAFRTHVPMVNVSKMGQRSISILTAGVVDGLRVRVAMKQLLESSRDLVRDFFLIMTLLAKQVAIAAGRECSRWTRLDGEWRE